MSTVKTTISGSKLKNCHVFTINACLPREDYIFIKGVVYDIYNLPLPYCAVEITQLQLKHNHWVKIYSGVTFSDEFGSYGISVPWAKCSKYILKAYSR